VGGGLAAQRCCETLRALGHAGPITIAGAEGSEPYDRPPLSKEGLAGAATEPRFRPRSWYAEHDVQLRLGAAAVRLRPGARTVELAGGERLRYDDLLVATGSRPVMLPALAGFANVQALRTRAQMRLGAALESARGADRVQELVLTDGSRIATDHVVVAVGVRPATEWLDASGLELRGIHTALPHVYAAGDVTGGGHWEAAARQGAGVARALLGLDPAPPAPPSFWSDQLGLRLQCVGEPAGAHATIAADAEGRGFEAVYHRDGRVSAVLLADRTPADLRAARRLLTPEPKLERSAA